MLYATGVKNCVMLTGIEMCAMCCADRSVNNVVLYATGVKKCVSL